MELLNYPVKRNRVEKFQVFIGKTGKRYFSLFDCSQQLWLADFKNVEERQKFIEKYQLYPIN